MGRTYELTTSSNWQPLYNETFVAQSVSNTVLERFYPIPDVDIPNQVDNHILAVYTHSEDAQPHWKYAGKALFRLQTGIVVGGLPETVFTVKKLWLNQITLLIIPELSTTYAIRINIPFWIRDLNVVFWEYTGEVYDSHEFLLSTINSELLAHRSIMEAS